MPAAAARQLRGRERRSPFTRGMIKIASLVLALAIYVSWKFQRGGYDDRQVDGSGEAAMRFAEEPKTASMSASSSTSPPKHNYVHNYDDILTAARDEALKEAATRVEGPTQYDPDYPSIIQIERTRLPVYNDKIRELEKVLKYYSKAIGEPGNVNVAITLGKLGNIYKERYDVHKIAGGIKDAFSYFDRALEYVYEWDLAESNGQLYFELLFQRGIVHSTVGDGPSAIEDFAKALAVGGRSSREYSGLHLQRAWVYTHVMKEPSSAIPELRRAFEMDKCRCLESADTYSMYITSLVDSRLHTSEKLFWLGLIDEIKIAFVEYKPANCLAGKPETSKVNYFWLLFHCAEAANSSQAFTYLEKAHEIDLQSDKFLKMKNTLYNYDMHLSNEKVQSQMFEGSLMWKDAPMLHDIAPIFIVGFLRSGSTLLEKVMAAHPSIGSIGENTVLLRAMIQVHKENNALPALLQNIPNSPPVLNMINHWSDWVVDQMKQRFFDEQEQASHSLNPITALMAKKNYKDVKFIIDKTLQNYKYLYFIRMLFPYALILHTARDPFDTLLSCYKTQFASPDIAWTLDKSMLSNEYLLYLRTMQLYRRVFDERETNSSRRLRLLHVAYEGMVHEPDLMMNHVIGEHLGLPYDSSILNSDQRKAYGITSQTASIIQAQKNISTSSVGKWRRYKNEMKAFRTLLMRSYSEGLIPRVVDMSAVKYVVRAMYNSELSLKFENTQHVYWRKPEEI